MFSASIPKPMIEQMGAVLPLERCTEAYVCGSGAFRFERMLNKARPGMLVHSSDHGLLPSAVGRLLTEQPTGLRFVGRLEFLEELCGSDLDRVAGVVLAQEFARFAGDSAHAEAHWLHMRASIDELHAQAKEKLSKFLDGLELRSFNSRDFRDHANSAADMGGLIVCAPHLQRTSNDSTARFLAANIEQPACPARPWRVKDTGLWLDELEARGASYAVLYDAEIEGRQPVAEYRAATNRPLFLFSSLEGKAASLRRASHNSEPFKYDAIEPAAINEKSRVQITTAPAGVMNFLKDIYLAKNIHHVTGQYNRLVWIDGMLVGGFIMTRSKYEKDSLYVLSDFSISRERKLSKLVAMLTCCGEIIQPISHRDVCRYVKVATTAFTDKPMSMKYRGVFEKAKTADGHIQYEAQVRPTTIAKTFREWWVKHGRNS